MHTHFAGRAIIYEQYRPKLPPIFFDFLLGTCIINKTEKQNRYLDLGCGTGQLTIPMSQYFHESIGVDPAADMVFEAQRAAAQKKCCNKIKFP
jgi:tRNA/tmRNA/rRNA uracil-C5-methylase (TrmA/RlmC/RlmD family)